MELKLKRSSKNPILRPTSNEWESKWVYNCGVFEFDGSIHLLYRAQGEDGVSRFGLAKLSDPESVSERSSQPIFAPDFDTEYEVEGVEDPRVTKVGSTYYIVYVAASHYPPIVPLAAYPRSPDWRVRVSMATTKDFKSFTRFGVIIGHIDSKDAALFPEKVAGNFLLAHRVVPHIRLAIAPDGRNFKERGPLFGPREGMWDGWRIGIGAQPIKSPHGWLLFYHGVNKNKVYRLGLALLDLNDPTLVLARSDEPILEPGDPYEKEGFISNVVFTCGAIETDSEYLVYYGAADAVIGLARIDKETVFSWSKEHLGKGQYHRLDFKGSTITEETNLRQRREN